MIRLPLTPDEAAAVAYAVRLLSALAASNGSTEAAATALGMSRRTLDDHVAKLGLRDFQTRLWSRSERQSKRKAP